MVSSPRITATTAWARRTVLQTTPSRNSPSMPPLKIDASFHQASSTPSMRIISSPMTMPSAPTTNDVA